MLFIQLHKMLRIYFSFNLHMIEEILNSDYFTEC